MSSTHFGTNTKYDDTIQASWGYSIGDSLGAMVAKVYVKHGKVYMYSKYYIIDTYEFTVHWDRNDRSDGSLDMLFHSFHEYGMAKEYKIIGYMNNFNYWNLGDTEIIYSNYYREVPINEEAYHSAPID